MHLGGEDGANATGTQREMQVGIYNASHVKIKGDDFFWHNDAGMCFRSGMRRFDGSWH